MSNGWWRGPRPGSRRSRSFLLFALGSIGTFAMAARAVHWLDGPPWLALAFLGVGLVLAGYYLLKLLSRPQPARARKR
ncbi:MULTISPECIES: hypothetical protein [unclassified Arthrobacter]|uniref:hypothetical protein n=1 Tax=unclassified Arthrobacter TaxID=235627 RepID=UPI002E0862E1|nr:MULTISPECIES: hypothetical protein [unclassified Arthrobacter]MEC5192971.1 hypothetical protein [Arthrobacter sp. MP_M4]MEC5204521.1 hypothetical protein [Arthrobacter sp. MP_M7]